MIRFPSVSWPESKLVITRVGIPRHLITAKRAENLLGLWMQELCDFLELGPGLREVIHLASSGPSRSCLGHWVGDAANFLPILLSSFPWCSQKPLRAKVQVASTSTVRANRKSREAWVPLPGPAGRGRHTPLARLGALTQSHFSPSHKFPPPNQIPGKFSFL